MCKLERYRLLIDDIDKNMIRLFEKRMETAEKIAEYKLENDIGILNSSREEMVIESALNELYNKDYKDELTDFVNNLMQISRKIQQKKIVSKNNTEIKIGFQGVKGSFGHQAALEYFPENPSTIEYMTFEDVFKGLLEDEIEYAVLPLENSSTGGISPVYDLIGEYGFYIIGEKCLRINQNLMGIKGSNIKDIKEIYSHTQGFEQSSVFLKKHPEWKLIPYHNTAYSAKTIANEMDPTKGAIAGDEAAKIYKLDILKKNINDNEYNYTRFVVISRKASEYVDTNKVSVMFSIRNKAGELYRVLESFHNNEINMLKIESRPIKNKPWKYMFYIDFEGSLNDKLVVQSIELIKEASTYFKILGNYNSDKNLWREEKVE